MNRKYSLKKKSMARNTYIPQNFSKRSTLQNLDPIFNEHDPEKLPNSTQQNLLVIKEFDIEALKQSVSSLYAVNHGLLEMPIMVLKEEGTGKLTKVSQAAPKKGELTFWKDVAKDILQPFAPKIPTFAKFKCKKQIKANEAETLNLSIETEKSEHVRFKPHLKSQENSIKERVFQELQLPIDRYKRLNLVNDSEMIKPGLLDFALSEGDAEEDQHSLIQKLYEKLSPIDNPHEVRSQPDLTAEFECNPITVSGSENKVRRKSACGWLFGDFSKFHLKTLNVVAPLKEELPDRISYVSYNSRTRLQTISRPKLVTQRGLFGRLSMAPNTFLKSSSAKLQAQNLPNEENPVFSGRLGYKSEVSSHARGTSIFQKLAETKNTSEDNDRSKPPTLLDLGVERNLDDYTLPKQLNNADHGLNKEIPSQSPNSNSIFAEKKTQTRSGSSKGRRPLALNIKRLKTIDYGGYGYKEDSQILHDQTNESPSLVSNKRKKENNDRVYSQRGLGHDDKKIFQTQTMGSIPGLNLDMILETRLSELQGLPFIGKKKYKKEKRHAPSITTADDIKKHYSYSSLKVGASHSHASSLSKKIQSVPKLDTAPDTTRSLSYGTSKQKVIGSATSRDSYSPKENYYFAFNRENSSNKATDSKSTSINPQSFTLISQTKAHLLQRAEAEAYNSSKSSTKKKIKFKKIINPDVVEMYSTDSTRKVLLEPIMSNTTSKKRKPDTSHSHKNPAAASTSFKDSL